MTGGSDGIGEAYCHELAKSGFNIVIVSRTLEKMERVAGDLRRLYNVQVKLVQFDFANFSTPEHVMELHSKLNEINEDVCVVANNAGKAHANPLAQHSVDIIFNMVNVNVNASIFIARYFSQKFKNRWEHHKKRSAIINVSSVGSLEPSGALSVYCGSKAFNRLFSLSQRLE